MENERKHSRPPRTGAATDAVRIAVPPSREPRRAAHPRLAATAPRQPHGLDRRSALGGALTVPARPRSHPVQRSVPAPGGQDAGVPAPRRRSRPLAAHAQPRLAATAPRQPHGLDRRSALGGALTV